MLAEAPWGRPWARLQEARRTGYALLLLSGRFDSGALELCRETFEVLKSLQ